MFEKGAIVVCIKSRRGITVGKEYEVQRFLMGQSPEYDRVVITNDAGVIRQTYSASVFELAKSES